MIWMREKRGHKLQAKRKCHTRAVEAKWNSAFIVKDVNGLRRIAAHVQLLVRYRITQRKKEISKEFKDQVAYYETMLHVVDRIEGDWKRQGEYEVLVTWLGFEDHDRTWEPFESMIENVPCLLEDYMYSGVERNLKQGILDLYF